MDISTKMWISDEKDLGYYLNAITENNTSANIHIPLTMNCNTIWSLSCRPPDIERQINDEKLKCSDKSDKSMDL